LKINFTAKNKKQFSKPKFQTSTKYKDQNLKLSELLDIVN